MDLSSANLSGARLLHVDLSGASLVDADLRGAGLRWVQLRAARMTGADCRDGFWEHVDAGGANLDGADARSAIFLQCGLQHASLRGAVLSLAKLPACRCARADFTGAVFGDVTVVGSDFESAVLDGAVAFADSREIVVEVLRRELPRDLEWTMLVGAAAIERTWCYEEWARTLKERPDVLRTVLAAFARHPASGCAEALELALAAA